VTLSAYEVVLWSFDIFIFHIIAPVVYGAWVTSSLQFGSLVKPESEENEGPKIKERISTLVQLWDQTQALPACLLGPLASLSPGWANPIRPFPTAQ
jgi:hypothetical protein